MQNNLSRRDSYESFTYEPGCHPDPGRPFVLLEQHGELKNLRQARTRTILTLQGLAITPDKLEQFRTGLPDSEESPLSEETLSDLSSLNSAESLMNKGISNLNAYFSRLKILYEIMMEEGESDEAFRLVMLDIPREIHHILLSDKQYGVLTEDHHRMFDDMLRFCEERAQNPEHEELLEISLAAIEPLRQQLAQNPLHQTN